MAVYDTEASWSPVTTSDGEAPNASKYKKDAVTDYDDIEAPSNVATNDRGRKCNYDNARKRRLVENDSLTPHDAAGRVDDGQKG